MSSSVGILEWFCPGEFDRTDAVIEQMNGLGIRHIRTGISWAEFCAPEGPAWYDWLIPRLAATMDVLPCCVYTPPSLGIRPYTAAPPRRSRDYADWIDSMLTRYGKYFEYVEFWNEPNNASEWDWTLDPAWHRFCEMVGAAAYWTKHRGWKTVLGGMAPVDPEWLRMLCERGVIAHIDVVGVHGFPGIWEPNWQGWSTLLSKTRSVLDTADEPREIWITESGYSTWKHDELRQVQAFAEAQQAQVERVYWYSAHDLDVARPAIDGFHEDEREYHFGLRRCDGSPKLLQRLLRRGGREEAQRFRDLVAGNQFKGDFGGKTAVITSGLSFIGRHLVSRMIAEGWRVRVVDIGESSSALDAAYTLAARYEHSLELCIADLHEPFVIDRILHDADLVFHLANDVPSCASRAQVLEQSLMPVVAMVEALEASKHDTCLIAASVTPVWGMSIAVARRFPRRAAATTQSAAIVRAAECVPDARFVLGGNGWVPADMPDNVRCTGHVYTRDHNAFNCSTRAVLNINRESMARYGHSPATRVFEAAGAGACVITDAWEGVDEFLEPGTEWLVARDGEQVAELVQALTPERATSIGHAARARVLRNHTYEQRAALVDRALSEVLTCA